MLFGKKPPSPQSWTMGSFPAGPPAMFVTSVPAYSAASPYYSYPSTHFPASPVFMPVSLPIQPIPVQVPVPVAVQSPMIQVAALPTTTTTYTVVQSTPHVPSPVIHAPIAIAPPRSAPNSPPRRPRSMAYGSSENALMLVQSPQQIPASPSNITINIERATPQQPSMQLHAVPLQQSVFFPFFTVRKD
jgi:hypothetical protein